MTETTELLSPPARVYQRGAFDCFRASVASLLGISWEEADGPTPAAFFDGKGHDWRGWQKWAGRRGLVFRNSNNPRQIELVIDSGTLWLAYLHSPPIAGEGDAFHMVVMHGDRIVHDPDRSPPQLEGLTIEEADELGWHLCDATVIVWRDASVLLRGAVPADNSAPRHGKARAPVNFAVPAVFSAQSSFDTESGAITGDSLAVGGVWTVATGSDTDDFSAGGGVATRATTLDTGAGPEGEGRYVSAGTTSYTDIAATVEVKNSTRPTGEPLKMGLYLRGDGTASNFLKIGVSVNEDPPGGDDDVRVTYVIANVSTDLAAASIPHSVGQARTLLATVTAAGVYSVYLDGQRMLTGASSVLATGGTLASGRVGIFDDNGGAGAVTRTYDNFAAWVPTNDAAIYSGKSLQFRYDDTLRDDSGGTVVGRPPIARGARAFLPQSGSEGKICRVVAKAAPNDLEEAPRDNIAVSTKLEVKATPRYWVAPR